MRNFTQNIPKPNLEFNFAALSQNYEAMDLEIGAGKGLHAIKYCQANPDRMLLAVEKTHVRFSSLTQRKENHPHLANLVTVQADATAFVSHFLPHQSLDRVFLLYPNPYHKLKHANLRWHNRSFFAELLKKMKFGAELTVATNLEWYAQEAAQTFQKQWQLEITDLSAVDPQIPPRTHFEKKYLLRGETCWNLKFRRLAL